MCVCLSESNTLKSVWLCSRTAVTTTTQTLTLVQLLSFLSLLGQKEERTMLEDTKAALSDLDKVTVFFRQLEDECLVASKRLPSTKTDLPHSKRTGVNEQLYGFTNSEWTSIVWMRGRCLGWNCHYATADFIFFSMKSHWEGTQTDLWWLHKSP